MEKYASKIKKAILFLTPFICSVMGLIVLEKEPVLDSLFNSVEMYLMNYGDTPPNILVEIARWTAPLVTASGLLLAINSLRTAFSNRIKYLKKNSVAVYGTDEDKNQFLQALGSRGINGQDCFVPAQRYILTGSEEDNFSFYEKYKTELSGKNVYLKCSNLPPQSIADPNLKLFCPEETAARLFWKQRELYTLSAAKKHVLKIVLLGFGKLGEELLLLGLQNNIFAPDQKIEYHIFGGDEAFFAVHKGLEKIEDAVIVHQDEWYNNLPLIESANLLLVLEQKEQMALLEKLLLSTTRAEMDVFASASFMEGLLSGQERLRLFFWEKESCRPEYIFNDLLLERAKRINLRYSHLYNNVSETDETKEQEWQKLDAFTRYSNISAADYHEVRLSMLKAAGLKPDGADMTAQHLELLSELEHIRWCRYHYLNNWKYGIPENGKNKDKNRRIHTDLVPYNTLTDADKEKDRENIRILLAIPSL